MSERVEIERLLNGGAPVVVIAEKVGFHAAMAKTILLDFISDWNGKN